MLFSFVMISHTDLCAAAFLCAFGSDLPDTSGTTMKIIINTFFLVSSVFLLQMIENMKIQWCLTPPNTILSGMVIFIKEPFIHPHTIVIWIVN